MLINELKNTYAKNKTVEQILQLIKANKLVHFQGLITSLRSIIFSTIHHQAEKSLLIILDDAEKASYLYNDIVHIVGEDNVGYLPSSFKKSRKHGEKDYAYEILRTQALKLLSSPSHSIVVTSIEAISEKVVANSHFNEYKIDLNVGDNYDTELLAEKLDEYGFEYVDFVYEPGQYSKRGSILDIYSFSHEVPYRVDFFDDEIESIRTFDIEKQLSIENKSLISIIPNLATIEATSRSSVFNYIQAETIIATDNAAYIAEMLDILCDEDKGNNDFIDGKVFIESISRHTRIEFGANVSEKEKALVKFDVSPQLSFAKNFELIASNIREYQEQGYNIFISSDSQKQTDRIKNIFQDREDNINFTPILHTIHEGFADNDAKICIFTDHQIFERYHKYKLRTDAARFGKIALTLKELNNFSIGDYVVHIDHGIGKFGGLMRTNVNGKQQEVVKLIFKDDDIIFVSIHGLHRISKYKGKDASTPRINKIGTGAWERLKERTKSKVKDIARDLIKLYAARKAEKGFEYTPDTYLQHELEASFIYEDTPDQTRSTNDIKRDMESSLPMDRLVCGDVGFGKTEIAIRAAFKAVADNKQVAVLVPTTVLAFQHFKTFKERLKNFPCNVEYLSRAKKASEVKIIKEKLKNGQIDIIIGTHKIVGKDITFKDLGLLIIDEEQKFGVAIKEKLKSLKVNVDTLTLTATPIPRTLQFSLMGARDLSVLTTPPPNRYPIYTEVSSFDDEVIREAITHEIDRNGQVFFVNNRVQNIYLIEQKIRALVPNVRIAVAHGQMPPEQLEQTIIDFIDYEYDVLIATTVIESGIDISNVNTIIINNAQAFGLSDLHQLRGRVGRSNRKAYCYLLTPPLSTLSTDARRRLQAIETFSDLGSGFNIAMQDLDIRGAGNILGAEQSGFITDLGYETYQKILAEAMEELRDEEFAQLFEEQTIKNKNYVSDCYFETDLELMLPAHYVESVSERMSLYAELDNVKNIDGLIEFEKRLIDRFGKLPLQTKGLITAVKLRWNAQKLGIERLILKKDTMIAYLVYNQESVYYRSPEFGKVLNYLTSNPHLCRLAEKDGKRQISIKKISDINQAYMVLSEMLE